MVSGGGGQTDERPTVKLHVLRWAKNRSYYANLNISILKYLQNNKKKGNYLNYMIHYQYS
jgi:hypothetical protein